VDGRRAPGNMRTSFTKLDMCTISQACDLRLNPVTCALHFARSTSALLSTLSQRHQLIIRFFMCNRGFVLGQPVHCMYGEVPLICSLDRFVLLASASSARLMLWPFLPRI